MRTDAFPFPYRQPPMRLMPACGQPAPACEPEAPILPEVDFAAVVENAPLVAIDLIVEDEHRAVLLGMRSNPPAQGYWFVPGGRVRKNEMLEAAFIRLTGSELGRIFEMPEARFMGVYQHFYNTNFAGVVGATTHYVVLAYRLQARRDSLRLPKEQHDQYLWIARGEVMRQPRIHPYAQAYFSN